MSNVSIFWACLALILIGLETMAPGVLFLWLGFAAAGVFILSVIGLPMSVLVQTMAFVLLSFVTVGVYWKFFRSAGEKSDQPLLNKKQDQLVGMLLNLETAITNGQGRVKIGDAFWQVQGPDCPQGTLVRIVSVEAGLLKIVPAE